MPWLRDMRQLVTLNLKGSSMTRAGIVQLGSLSNITRFSVEETDFRHEDLPLLRSFPGLRYLYLGGCDIGGPNLGILAEFDGLVYLSLRGAKITDEHVRHLAGLGNLTTLGLDSTEVTEACLPHLKDLDSLRTLYLSGTKVDPPALTELGELKSLTRLYLKEFEIEQKTLDELKKECPGSASGGSWRRQTMNTWFWRSIWLVALAPPALAEVDFARQVLPILSEKCFVCHGPDAKKDELRLDSAAAATALSRRRPRHRSRTPGAERGSGPHPRRQGPDAARGRREATHRARTRHPQPVGPPGRRVRAALGLRAAGQTQGGRHRRPGPARAARSRPAPTSRPRPTAPPWPAAPPSP